MLARTPLHPDDANVYAEIQAFYEYVTTKFDLSRYRCRWFYGHTFEACIRTGLKSFESGSYYSLEIANINVYPGYQKQGHFSRLLEFAFALIRPQECLYIENVLFMEHGAIYLKRGFTEVVPHYEGSVDIPSYYKVKIGDTKLSPPKFTAT